MFNPLNLYVGPKCIVYRTGIDRCVCLVDHFGGNRGVEMLLSPARYTQCSDGTEERLKELEELYKKYVENRTYPNLGL